MVRVLSSFVVLWALLAGGGGVAGAAESAGAECPAAAGGPVVAAHVTTHVDEMAVGAVGNFERGLGVVAAGEAGTTAARTLDRAAAKTIDIAEKLADGDPDTLFEATQTVAQLPQGGLLRKLMLRTPAPRPAAAGRPVTGNAHASVQRPKPGDAPDAAPPPAPNAGPKPATPDAGPAGPRRPVKLLGDAAKALAEIEQGAARPNVRNPKPFVNDGPGGTPRLPEGVNYTEHTVNPRPPRDALDGKRIVTGSDGSIWYTDDHFRTWTRVK